MTERLWVQTPAEETIFQAPLISIKSLKQKEIMKCSNLSGIVAYAVIALMGGWALQMVGL